MWMAWVTVCRRVCVFVCVCAMYIVVEGHVVSQWTGFGSERSLLLDLREPYRKFE